MRKRTSLVFAACLLLTTGLSPAYASEAQKEVMFARLYGEAQRAFDRRDFETAIMLCQSMVKAAPNNSAAEKAHTALVHARFESTSTQWWHVLTEMLSFLRLYPDTVFATALPKIERTFRDVGNKQELTAKLEEVLFEKPLDAATSDVSSVCAPEVLETLHKAHTALKNQNFKEAIAFYRTTIATDHDEGPASMRARIALVYARLAVASEQHMQLEAEFRKFTALYPNKKHEMERLLKAVEQVGKAIEQVGGNSATVKELQNWTKKVSKP